MQGEQTTVPQTYVPYQAFANSLVSTMNQPCESPYLAKPTLEGSSQILSQAYPWQSSFSPLGQPASTFMKSQNNGLPSQSLNYSSYPVDYSSSSQMNPNSNQSSKGIGQTNSISTFDNNRFNNQNNSSSLPIQSSQFNLTKSPIPDSFVEKTSTFGYQAQHDCAVPQDALSVGQLGDIKTRVDSIIGNAKRNVEGQHHNYLMSASAVGSFKRPIPEYVSYGNTYSTQKQNDSVVVEASNPEISVKHRVLATSAMPFSGKWLDYSIPTDLINTKGFPQTKYEDQSTKQITSVNIGQSYSILNVSSHNSNQNISNGYLFNPEIKPLDLEITKGNKSDNSYCATRNEVTAGFNTSISAFNSNQTNNNNKSIDIPSNDNKVFLGNSSYVSNQANNTVYGERVNGLDNFKQLQDVNSKNPEIGNITNSRNIQLGKVQFGYDLPSSGFGSPLNLISSKYGISKFDDSWKDDIKDSDEIKTSLIPVSLRPSDIDYSSLALQNSPLSQIVDKKQVIPDGKSSFLSQIQVQLPKQEQQLYNQPSSLVGLANNFIMTSITPQQINKNTLEIQQQVIPPPQTSIQITPSPITDLTKGSNLIPQFRLPTQRENEEKLVINQIQQEKIIQNADQAINEDHLSKPINKDPNNQTEYERPIEKFKVVENQDKKEQSSNIKISELVDPQTFKKDTTQIQDQQEEQPKKTIVMLELNKWMDPTFQNFIKKNFSRQQKKELIEKLQRQIQSDCEDDNQENSKDEDSSKKIIKKDNEKEKTQSEDEEETKHHQAHIKEIKTDAEQLEYIQFSERCKAELQRQKGITKKQVDSTPPKIKEYAEDQGKIHYKISTENNLTKDQQKDNLEEKNIDKIKKSKKTPNNNDTATQKIQGQEEELQLKKLNSDENAAMTAESKLLLQDIYDEVQHALKKYDYFIQEAQQKKLTSSLVNSGFEQNNTSNNPGKPSKSVVQQQVHSEIPSEIEIEKQLNQQNSLHRSNSMKSTLARDSNYFHKNSFSRPPSYSGHRTISIGNIRKEDSLIMGQNSLEKSLSQNEEITTVKISKMDEEEAENAFNNRRQQIYKSLQNATKLRKSSHFLSQKPMNHSSSKIPGLTPSSYARTPSSSISSKSALGFSGQLQETHFLNASVISNSQTKASVLLQNVLSPKSTVRAYAISPLNGSSQQQKYEESIDDKNKVVLESSQSLGQSQKDKQKSEMQSPKQLEQQGIQKQQEQQAKEDLLLSNSFQNSKLSPSQKSKSDQKYLSKPKNKYDQQQIFQSRQPYRQPSQKHQRITEDSLKALSKTVISPLKRKSSNGDEDTIKQTKRSQGSQILHASSQEREKKEEEEFFRQEEAVRQIGKLRQSIEMNSTKDEKNRNVLQIDLLQKESKQLIVQGKDVGVQKSQGKNEGLLQGQKKKTNQSDKSESELKGVEDNKKQVDQIFINGVTKKQKKLTNLRKSLIGDGNKIESYVKETVQNERKETIETEKEQIYLTEHLASQESILSTEIIEDQWKSAGDINQQAQMMNLRFSEEERKDKNIVKGNIALSLEGTLLKGVDSNNTNTFHQKKLAILCDIEDLNRQIQLENADNNREEGQNFINNNTMKKNNINSNNNQNNKQNSFSSDSLLLNGDLIIEDNTVNLIGGDDIQDKSTKDDKIKKDSKSEIAYIPKQEEKEKKSSKRQSLQGQQATKPFSISIPSIIIKETESINKLPEETKQSALLIPLEQILPDTDSRQDGKRGKSLHQQGETHKIEVRGKSEAPQRINSKNDTSDQEDQDQEEEKEEINLYRTVGSQNLAGFEKRNEKWIQARKNRLESTAKNQTNQQMKECTFKPHTNQYYQPSKARTNKSLKSSKPKISNNTNNTSSHNQNNLSAKVSTLNSYSSKRLLSQKQQTPEQQPPQKESSNIPAAVKKIIKRNNN